MSLVTIIVALCATIAANDQGNGLKGKIEGTITDEATGEPLVGANVYLVDRFGGAISDDEGRFVIRGLAPGTYALRISHLGFEPEQLDDIVVAGDESVQITANLSEKIHTLKGITVTPGRFAIMGTEAVASQSLTRRELETTPQMGEDLYRAVKRLPEFRLKTSPHVFTCGAGSTKKYWSL